jgi:ABC-type transporter lipoprotein component MlaA
MKRRKTDKKASIGLAVAFIIFGATGISMAGEASSSNTAAMAQEEFESDPWEPFNSKMFFFNHDILDQYILKPVAKGWNLVLPDVVSAQPAQRRR